MTQQDNHYTILGINPSSTQEEIKQAYRKLSMAEHPDRGGDSEKFSKINDAFQVLSDPNKRNRYDLLINVVKVDTSDVSEYKAKNTKVDFNIKQGLGSVSVKKV